jgi:hypothetical protein
MKLLAQLHNPVLPALIGGSKSGASVEAGGTALGRLISSLVGALFIAGFLLAFFFVIQGGLQWITAGGDKTKLETARDQITSAMIGIIIVGAAYALTTIVGQFFGLDLSKLTFPSITQ